MKWWFVCYCVYLVCVIVFQQVQAVDIITTIAGTGGSSYSGDGGVATSAVLYTPLGVALDSSGKHSFVNILYFYYYLLSIGNIYIADSNNNCIRKITVSTGIITTIAGTSTGSYGGDNGAATSATLKTPSGVVLDSSGGQTYFKSLIILHRYSFVLLISFLPPRQRVHR